MLQKGIICDKSQKLLYHKSNQKKIHCLDKFSVNLSRHTQMFENEH